jgi:alanine racemase
MGTLFQFPYRTVAEISLTALVKNLATLRSMSRKEIIPVVKADAYGHGMIAIAKALVGRGSTQMLAVATLEEAIELRKKFTTSVSILVLSGFLPHQVEAYSKYHLIPMIHSLHHLKTLLGRRALPEIHLKIDTGMNRLGILESEVPDAIRVLQKIPLKLAGLATHFADSEVVSSTFIDKQIAVFQAVHAELQSKRLLQTDARIHTGNSGAILQHKVNFSTSARPGIGLYGILPNPRTENTAGLVPVLQWKARVLTIKALMPGSTVGYGRTYKAKRKEKIALLPIGYADGYPRLLSNLGEVLLEGKRVPVRGRVSMDLTAVDCTHIAGAREGSVVTLIGGEGKDQITAWEVAHWAQTIPYEIFCGLSSRVPRVYLE